MDNTMTKTATYMLIRLYVMGFIVMALFMGSIVLYEYRLQQAIYKIDEHALITDKELKTLCEMYPEIWCSAYNKRTE
jgi:hypothetical protein